MKGIGGKGRLTLAWIDTTQSCYRKTICDFKGVSETVKECLKQHM